MYNDWFSIGPFTVHGYGACIALGVLLALFLSSYRAKKRGMDDDAIYGIVLCATVFGFLCSKLMFCIVEWKSFIANPVSFLSSSGFVVYGGITGGIVAILVYTKVKKLNFVDYLEIVAPGVAFAQGLGRIGCFFAGCCYGRPTDSWIGIAFKNSMYAPNGIKMIPTQLISAGLDVLNGFVLLFIASKVKKKGIVISCYITFYSVGRFFVEMLRDDPRGNVGTLSTSQFYGIASLIIGVIIFIIAMVKNVPAVEVLAKGKEDIAKEDKNEEV